VVLSVPFVFFSNNIYLSSQKEYFFDKRPSIGGHLPVRNATNDVTQNQELHMLLFQE